MAILPKNILEAALKTERFRHHMEFGKPLPNLFEKPPQLILQLYPGHTGALKMDDTNYVNVGSICIFVFCKLFFGGRHETKKTPLDKSEGVSRDVPFNTLTSWRQNPVRSLFGGTIILSVRCLIERFWRPCYKDGIASCRRVRPCSCGCYAL